MGVVRTEKVVREGIPAKRRAILAAARELFVRQGVDRVSMDAVASRAKVSKATVYEYFGDKHRLFLAILADAAESLMVAVERSIGAHLADDAGITSTAELERALTAFAVDLSEIMMGTTDFAAVSALVAQQRWQESSPGDDVSTQAVEEVLAERISHYTAAGLLDIQDPAIAAAQFGALTILLAFDRHPHQTAADHTAVRRVLSDGVRTFMRAFGAR